MEKRLFSYKAYRIFLVNITIIIVIVISGIFTGLFIRNSELVNGGILTRARADFNNIVLTRKWNAEYGGVYVEKKQGVISNPYLKNPDVETVDGRIFTKKNPALMTREISEYADKKGLFSFHITSLKPLNPDNAPDEFETEALKLFEEGHDEVFRKVKINHKTYFRYMSPLYVENSCLQCHAEQGYKTGDVRGGISVKYDLDQTEKMLRINNYLIIFLGVLTVSLLLGTVWFLVLRLMNRHIKAQQKIREMAVTDELTGLYNRRYLFLHLDDEVKRALRYRRSLGCIMIDIDHFKRINDSYGHQTGDAVLREVSGAIKNTCRDIDMVVRYGGEEVLVLTPEISAEGLKVLAERIRRSVNNLRIKGPGGEDVSVTISLGVSISTPEDLSAIDSSEEVIKYADEALYKAKLKGRNRTEIYSKG